MMTYSLLSVPMSRSDDPWHFMTVCTRRLQIGLDKLKLLREMGFGEPFRIEINFGCEMKNMHEAIIVTFKLDLI